MKTGFKRWMMMVVVSDWIALAVVAILGWSVIDALDVLKPKEKLWIIQGPVSFYLQDSSRVVLDKDATLICDTAAYGKKNREVMLKGRAFFKVMPDCSRPFMVQSEKTTITVLGTSFEVNGATAKHETAVTVVTGKVNVSHGHRSEDLLPNQQIVLNDASGALLRRAVLADTVQTWTAEVVDKIFIEEAMQHVAKKFNVTVVVEGEDLKKRIVNARFIDQHDALDEVLKTMELMTKATFTERNGVLVMRK